MGRRFFNTLSYSFSSTLAALLLTVPLVGQEYRWEKDETLGIQFRVHKKLTRAPAPFAGLIPHYRYWYDVAEEKDAIQTKYGPFNWYIFVLEFPKELGNHCPQ